MVKAVLHRGVIEPLSPLPDDWREGQELLVQEGEPAEPEDWDAWEQEMEELAAKIPPEDFVRLEEVLAEADREAKSIVRRQMGLV